LSDSRRAVLCVLAETSKEPSGQRRARRPGTRYARARMHVTPDLLVALSISLFRFLIIIIIINWHVTNAGFIYIYFSPEFIRNPLGLDKFRFSFSGF
jgi:hypothetical protein